MVGFSLECNLKKVNEIFDPSKTATHLTCIHVYIRVFEQKLLSCHMLYLDDDGYGAQVVKLQSSHICH